MISLANLALFAATSTVLAFTPGPDVIYVMTRGMAQGRKAALAAAAGFALGNFGHTFFAIVEPSRAVARPCFAIDTACAAAASPVSRSAPGVPRLASDPSAS